MPFVSGGLSYSPGIMCAINQSRIMSLVSVVIPTYNRKRMLRRAISSVLSQTFQDFEILVVSDGSTDDTDEVVASFRDPRIRLLKHESRRGASAARNTGMKASCGKFIAFLDDDDEWTSNKLEVQLPVVENSAHNVGLIYAWMEYFQNGKSVGVQAPELRGNVFVEMLDKQAIGGCPTIIIKREIVDKVGYFDENLPRGNDGDYWRRICKVYDVDFVPETLAKVHIGHERITGNTKISIRGEIKALEKRLRLFESDFNKHLIQKANVMTLIGMDYLLIGNYRKFFTYLCGVIKCNMNCRDKMLCLFGNLRRVIGKLKCRLKYYIGFILRA